MITAFLLAILAVLSAFFHSPRGFTAVLAALVVLVAAYGEQTTVGFALTTAIITVDGLIAAFAAAAPMPPSTDPGRVTSVPMTATVNSPPCPIITMIASANLALAPPQSVGKICKTGETSPAPSNYTRNPGLGAIIHTRVP